MLWPLLVYAAVMASAITGSAVYALRQHVRRMTHGGGDESHWDRAHRRIGWILSYALVRLVPALSHAMAATTGGWPTLLDQVFALWDVWTLHQFSQLLLYGYFYRAAAVRYASPFPIYHRDKCVASQDGYIDARLYGMLHHHIDRSAWPPCAHWLPDVVHYGCVVAALWQCLIAMLVTVALISESDNGATLLLLRLASLVPVVVLGLLLHALGSLVSAGGLVAAVGPHAKLACLWLTVVVLTLVALVQNRELRCATLLLALWCQTLCNHWLYPAADELTRAIDMRYATNFAV
jgi:hypothetical protein